MAIHQIKNKVVRGFVISSPLLPFIVTPVVGTLVFAWLFRDFGLVTYLLKEMGFEIYWFSSELNARSLLILHNIWHVTPFAIIVFFAGLQSVPQDSIEAASTKSWSPMSVTNILFSLINSSEHVHHYLIMFVNNWRFNVKTRRLLGYV